MSIRIRIEDAQYLWGAVRLEGAFVLVLIAAAATARRMFPNEKSDKKAFEDFLNQGWFKRLSVEYRGEVHPIYHIFYKWFRCELIHEVALPVDVEFMADPKPGALGIRAGGAPDYILRVSHGWFRELVKTITDADVNRDLFCKKSNDGNMVN